MAEAPDTPPTVDGLLEPVSLSHAIRGPLRERYPKHYDRFKTSKALPLQVQVVKSIVELNEGKAIAIGDEPRDKWGELYFGGKLAEAFGKRLQDALQPLAHWCNAEEVERLFHRLASRLMGKMPEGVVREQFLELLDRYERKAKTRIREINQTDGGITNSDNEVLSEGNARKQSASEKVNSGGRSLLEKRDPEGLCNALEAILDFVEDLDPDSDQVPGRKLREAVGKKIDRSPSTARDWMGRAVKVLNRRYDLSIPSPKTTVGFYYEHRASLREGLEQYRKDLAKNTE